MIKAAIQLKRDAFTLDVAFETGAHVTGVFGPSGAGKSTLINVIAGLERPDVGTIMLDGETIFSSSDGTSVPVHRRRIGVVFQEHRLFPHHSVRGNLLYGARDGQAELARIVGLLELGTMLDRRVTQLSGGERQRVALGRALLSKPRLLLLDEPLASLDVRLRQQIIPYFKRVRDESGVPIVYVSHELSEILQLTDHLLVLEAGRLAGQGRFSDIVHDAPVLSVMHDRGIRNVLSARVVEHHADEGISVLAIGPTGASGQWLIAPLCAAPSGATVHVSVQPWDVALSAAPVQGISIQNQIRGIARRCTTHQHFILIEVDVGEPLLVEISRRAATTLGVQVGGPVVCLIKSSAIRYVDVQ